MVDAVLDAVVDVLGQNGVCALREFPDRCREKSEACVTVGARNVRCLGAGLGDYLGLRSCENGESVEVFGKRLEIELVFGVFVPFCAAGGADDCVRCGDEIFRVLGCFGADAQCAPLHGSVRVLEAASGAVFADEELSCFKCECSVRCLAFFIAESRGEQGEFLDFVLKGAAIGVD